MLVRYRHWTDIRQIQLQNLHLIDERPRSLHLSEDRASFTIFHPTTDFQLQAYIPHVLGKIYTCNFVEGFFISANELNNEPNSYTKACTYTAAAATALAFAATTTRKRQLQKIIIP